MEPVGYSEYVGVPSDTPREPQEHVVTYCDLEAVNRCKEEVRFGPGLAPTGFRSSVICYIDCSKRRFINRVEYEPKMVPRRFSTTCFIRPRHLVRSCATFLDVPSDNFPAKRHWFKSSVQIEPKTFSSCKVQGSGSLEYTKTVEEKQVRSDGTVKIHVENYKNGELINVNDVMKDSRHDGMTTSDVMSSSDVISGSDSDYNPRIREALDTLRPKENGLAALEDLVWMDGYMDDDNNIVAIPIRNEESPDLFYQADDEDNEIFMDDNANVTHHLKKKKIRKSITSSEENLNYVVSDRYRSGPFVYNVPKRNKIHNGGEEPDYKQLNGFGSHSLGQTIRYSERFTQY